MYKMQYSEIYSRYLKLEPSVDQSDLSGVSQMDDILGVLKAISRRPGEKSIS